MVTLYNMRFDLVQQGYQFEYDKIDTTLNLRDFDDIQNVIFVIFEIGTFLFMRREFRVI